MKQKELIAKIDHKAIEEAIRLVEGASSSEIRVHVQPRIHGGDVRTVAERTFERLGMTKTAARNGVLLFIASEDQKFAILGDRAFDEKVQHSFWETIASRLSDRFRHDEFTAGIVEAIEAAGEILRHHFPFVSGDVNELPNEISFDEGKNDSSTR